VGSPRGHLHSLELLSALGLVVLFSLLAVVGPGALPLFVSQQHFRGARAKLRRCDPARSPFQRHFEVTFLLPLALMAVDALRRWRRLLVSIQLAQHLIVYQAWREDRLRCVALVLVDAWLNVLIDFAERLSRRLGPVGLAWRAKATSELGRIHEFASRNC